MSSLMERIAAKKALAEAAPPIEVDILGLPVAKEETVAKEVAPTPVVESVPEGKPLTFAEKMALKKASLIPTTPTVAATPVPAPGIVSVTETEALVVEVDVPAEEVDLSGVSMEDQQAYIDIKTKINMLSTMSDDSLKDAMTDLKKALLKNPQACYLILPHDIGEMVIALRAMKNEAVVEAATAKEKGPKKAKASKALTASEIAAAFDEL